MIFIAKTSLFPPQILSTAFAICQAFARVPAILAPIVAEMKGVFPLVLVGSLNLFSLLIVPKLTFNKKEKTCIKEMIVLKEKRSDTEHSDDFH